MAVDDLVESRERLRGLDDDADPPRREPLGQFRRRRDDENVAACVRHDALDLRVIGLPDDDDGVAAALELLGGFVRLADVGTRRIDDVESLVAGGVDDRRVDAVAADDERALGSIVKRVGDHDALVAQRGDRLRVVDQRAECVDFTATRSGLLGELEGAFDPVADTRVACDFDSHGLLLGCSVTRCGDSAHDLGGHGSGLLLAPTLGEVLYAAPAGRT